MSARASHWQLQTIVSQLRGARDQWRTRNGRLSGEHGGRELPSLRSLLHTDVLAAYHGDPAARSVDEVLLCYPGILAVIHHRLAHHLYRNQTVGV